MSARNAGAAAAAAARTKAGGAPPPLFVLAHSNGGGLSSKEEEEKEEEQVADLSRAGVLLGWVDTPALACSTEHGAVPYMTRGRCLGWWGKEIWGASLTHGPLSLS
jgi:hypothetical protein